MIEEMAVWLLWDTDNDILMGVFSSFKKAGKEKNLLEDYCVTAFTIEECPIDNPRTTPYEEWSKMR